jgi:hypothetical protein
MKDSNLKNLESQHFVPTNLFTTRDREDLITAVRKSWYGGEKRQADSRDIGRKHSRQDHNIAADHQQTSRPKNS